MGKFLLIAIAIGAGIKVYIDYYPGWKVDWDMKQGVAEANKQLPKVYDNTIRVEKFRYEKHVVYLTATIMDNVPVSDDFKPKFGDRIKQMYCTGEWRRFADSKVSLETVIKFEASNYRGIEWVYDNTPQLCV